MNFDCFESKRQPKSFNVQCDKVLIETLTHTNLWHRLYNLLSDNAPVSQTETEEKFFSFTIKIDFWARIKDLTGAES